MRNDLRWAVPVHKGSKLSEIGELTDENVSRISGSVPEDDSKFGDAYPPATTTQMNLTNMNDMTADYLVDLDVE